ncbi:MAG: hypothetical protein D6784_00135 [Chloroflexi bacterium]|nr:MAG: hypothetical protein D6784_00135 [Chloroflexota bacterium]
MIFVTVGTTDFSDLIRAVDALVPELGEEVVMQIGRGKYEPKNGEFFRLAPSLEPYYERASLVISHGGLGTVTEVMNRGLPLVAVEDPNQPDRHQTQLLQVWDEQKHLVWCRDLRRLPEAIEKARTTLVPYRKPECRIHLVIQEYLDKMTR